MQTLTFNKFVLGKILQICKHFQFSQSQSCTRLQKFMNFHCLIVEDRSKFSFFQKFGVKTMKISGLTADRTTGNTTVLMNVKILTDLLAMNRAVSPVIKHSSTLFITLTKSSSKMPRTQKLVTDPFSLRRPLFRL